MKLNKLFRLLVMGGAVIGGTPSCGPADDGIASGGGGTHSTGGTAKPTDGGFSDPGTGGSGGGVDFW